MYIYKCMYVYKCIYVPWVHFGQNRQRKQRARLWNKKKKYRWFAVHNVDILGRDSRKLMFKPTHRRPKKKEIERKKKMNKDKKANRTTI